MRRFSYKKLNDLLNDPIISPMGVMRAAGLSYTAFNKIRKGISVPSSNTLAALADVLNQSIDYFFEDEYLHRDNQEKEPA